MEAKLVARAAVLDEPLEERSLPAPGPTPIPAQSISALADLMPPTMVNGFLPVDFEKVSKYPPDPIEVINQPHLRHFPPAGPGELTIPYGEQEVRVPYSVATHKGLPLYFKDEEIIKVEFSPLDFNLETRSQTPYGITEDGRTVIQQQTTQGCVATSVAMVLADRGVVIDHPLNSLNSARRSALSGNPGLDTEATIKNGNCSHQVFNISEGSKGVGELKNLIDQHGSVVLESFGHVIVIDKIDEKAGSVALRDPFHGWAIQVSANTLANYIDKGGAECLAITGRIESVAKEKKETGRSLFGRLFGFFS